MKHLSFIFLLFSLAGFSQNIFVNEICVKNSNVLTDEDFNQFADWIELYNNEETLLDLSGYFLTDDTTYKSKWCFPSGSSISTNEYLIIWADDADTLIENLHTNFKLSSSNEWVALYDTDTNLIDLIEYPDQFGDISFGRAQPGLAYFSQPTPGLANTTTAYYSDERESTPILSLISGFYNVNTELTFVDILPGDIVYYTTDGSYPNENSQIYTEPILLTENTVIRSKTFGDNLPSKEVSCSYFIANTKQLPIVSLIINPDFLWSDSLGIFNDFEIGKKILWERSSNIQYFKNNSLKFETKNEIRLFGTTAYLLPQKSFAVFANDEIQFQIFNGKEVLVFDSFIMRSSSDDWKKTMFRDGFIHSIVQKKLQIDYQAYQPTVLYINGEYFGIFNLREKYNEDYLENNHGISKDSIDMLKLNYYGLSVEVLAGSSQKYYEMLDYLNNNDMTNDVVFEGVKAYLDIENYTNYIITQIYIGNRSYKHNIKAWRENNIVDGFNWLIYDTDRAYLGLWRQIFLLIYDADPILKKLLENINYRNHFLQQTCSHINATFRYSFITNLIDSLQANIAQEMPFHIEKWAPSGGVPSMDEWNSEVYLLKDFALKRKDTLLYRLDSVYNLSGQVSIHLKKSIPQGGDVYIEDVLIPYNDLYHTYFKGIPVKLVAKPRLGYHFIDWENISASDSIIYTFNSDQTVTARFEADCDIPQLITEDVMLVQACSPYYIYNDITVEIGATLFCEPGVEIFFGEDVKLEVFGSIDFLGTENDPIFIQGETGKYWKYIRSDSGNVSIKYANIYAGEKAISFANGGNILIKNCTFYESDKDDNDLISGNGAKVEFIDNVFYSNSDNTKKDCIDCDGIPYGRFTDNIFYDVTDDCIDIGEGSTDIFIEYNQAYNCESMGFSIGEGSVATISRNIIAYCNGGIQVHTDAMATIINNTLYDNEIGIKCYHYESTPNSGGSANVINTILSECILDYELQSNSQIDITYSLSDKLLHEGFGNIYDSPDFVNPLVDDFQLLAYSPCIDAGDILSLTDPDGTRADIGALFYNQNSNVPEIGNSFSVYPNPFDKNLLIRLNSSSLIQSINFYNLLGENVYSRNDIDENSINIEIDSKGLLLILVTDKAGNKYSMKLISK